MVANTPNGTGQRILVVDDDIAIRVLLQAVLRRLNFEVDLAQDGRMALELLEQHRYEVILLDLMMPRVNGFEFLARLDEQNYHPRPHIVVFTAAGQRGVDKLPPNSVCTAILKPFDLETFLSLIEQCLSGHRQGETSQG